MFVVMCAITSLILGWVAWNVCVCVCPKTSTFESKTAKNGRKGEQKVFPFLKYLGVPRFFSFSVLFCFSKWVNFAISHWDFEYCNNPIYMLYKHLKLTTKNMIFQEHEKCISARQNDHQDLTNTSCIEAFEIYQQIA